MPPWGLLLLLLCYCYVSYAAPGNQRLIRFVANKRYEAKFKSRDEFVVFDEWFKTIDERELAALNPGIVKIDPIDDPLRPHLFLGTLSPLQFPGLRIESTVEFGIVKDDASMIITCSEGSLKQMLHGNPFFAGVVGKLLPTVISRNEFRVSPEGLVNDASLTIQFYISGGFPVNAEMLERGGSNAIGQGIDKDLNAFIANVMRVSNCQRVDVG